MCVLHGLLLSMSNGTRGPVSSWQDFLQAVAEAQSEARRQAAKVTQLQQLLQQAGSQDAAS